METTDEKRNIPTVEEVQVTKNQNAQQTSVDPNSKRGKILAAIDKAGVFLKIPLRNILSCSAFFILIYILGWTLNAIYSNLHFDLPALRDFYLMVIGKQTADHGINSLLNSSRGEMPMQPPTNKDVK